MKDCGGTILRVDLTTGKINKEPLPESLCRKYIGGRGFIARILYDELLKGAEPLGPKNKVIVSTGPLSGQFVPSAGRTILGTKSPATHGYGEANVGGHFATELRQAGYDLLILEGQSEDPVFLCIKDGEVTLLSAQKYWGMGSLQTERLLKDELGEGYQCLTIGPAGEREVPIACVSHDFGRQAGRCGIGAVFGNKRLKAIAVMGTQDIPIADFREVLKVGKQMYQVCTGHHALELWQKYGTSSVVSWSNRIGTFPTRNFQSGHFSSFTDISGITMRERIVVRDKGCFACPMACGKYSRIHREDKKIYVEGPEYETAALLGGNCALSDIEDLAYANYLCDELGLDTISAGSAVAFAMECFERGIIGIKETEGLVLRFGESETVFKLLEKMGWREGIGDLLCKGVRAAAHAWGNGSEHFAMEVKGLEISGYESRNAPAMMLSYMTSDIGAHHRPSWAVTADITLGRDSLEGKAQRVVELQHLRPLFDILGVCRLPWIELDITPSFYVKALNACTGMDKTLKELLEISERVWNLTRLFNIRENPGYGRHCDYPPGRWMGEPVQTGPTRGKTLSHDQVDQLLDEYYKLRGWDENGIPLSGTLERLGLSKEAKEIGSWKSD